MESAWGYNIPLGSFKKKMKFILELASSNSWCYTLSFHYAADGNREIVANIIFSAFLQEEK